MFQQRGVSEDLPVVKVSLAEEGLMTAAEGDVLRVRSCWCWRGWRFDGRGYAEAGGECGECEWREVFGQDDAEGGDGGFAGFAVGEEECSGRVGEVIGRVAR